MERDIADNKTDDIFIDEDVDHFSFVLCYCFDSNIIHMR